MSRSHQIQRDGQDLYYETYGEGPPILLLHSFLCSIELWAPQIEVLKRGHRVIAMDLRGHGRSGHSRPHTLDNLVDDAIAVLDAEAVDNAVWCGLSIGGMITLRAVLRNPQRVRAMILVDTDGGAETFGIIAKHAALEVLARLAGIKSVRAPLLAIMFGQTTRRDKPELIAAWGDRFEALHVPSMMRTLHAIDRRKNLLPQLAAVRAPALIIHGHEDRALNRRRGKALADALPNAQWSLIERSGHLSCIEAPEAVNTGILAFLDTLAWERESPVR